MCSSLILIFGTTLHSLWLASFDFSMGDQGASMEVHRRRDVWHLLLRPSRPAKRVVRARSRVHQQRRPPDQTEYGVRQQWDRTEVARFIFSKIPLFHYHDILFWIGTFFPATQPRNKSKLRQPHPVRRPRHPPPRWSLP